jgi:hypothetical protein
VEKHITATYTVFLMPILLFSYIGYRQTLYIGLMRPKLDSCGPQIILSLRPLFKRKCYVGKPHCMMLVVRVLWQADLCAYPLRGERNISTKKYIYLTILQPKKHQKYAAVFFFCKYLQVVVFHMIPLL